MIRPKSWTVYYIATPFFFHSSSNHNFSHAEIKTLSKI